MARTKDLYKQKKKDLTEEQLAATERLKQVRKKTGCTQTEFAKFLGVSMSTVQHYEGGQQALTINYAKQICEKLDDVDISWLLFGTKQAPDIKNQLIEKIRDMDPDSFQFEFIRAITLANEKQAAEIFDLVTRLRRLMADFNFED